MILPIQFVKKKKKKNPSSLTLIVALVVVFFGRHKACQMRLPKKQINARFNYWTGIVQILTLAPTPIWSVKSLTPFTSIRPTLQGTCGKLNARRKGQPPDKLLKTVKE